MKSHFKSAKQYLVKANEILQTRGIQYGNSKKLHNLIAKRFSVVLGINITAYQVARLMIELKIARLDNGSYSDNFEDTIIDIINYTALAAEMNEPIKKDVTLNENNDPMFEPLNELYPRNPKNHRG